MQDVLMVGKNSSCNVFKLVVHALHSNFAKDSLEIWKVMLIFRIKNMGDVLSQNNTDGIAI